MKKLSFKEIPQEPCVVQKDGIICFFYVDDIVFAYKKDRKDEVNQIKESLQKTLTIKERKVGSLLFAAIATRPDIAFAASRLSRFNQRPGRKHHEAADRVFPLSVSDARSLHLLWGRSTRYLALYMRQVLCLRQRRLLRR